MENIISGRVESIVFRNDLNGYCVFSVMPEGQDNLLTCVGFVPQVHEGETLNMIGDYVTHPIYGKQLKVISCETVLPTSLSGIEKYLGSGVIKGIGEKLAKKIVNEFGEQTFSIIEDNPEKLSRIRGITLEKAIGIGETFREQAELRRLVLYLQDFGLSPLYAEKIYKRYKDGAIEIIKKNPYALADDIYGIGFKTADAIAFKMGTPHDSPFRIRAAVKYALSQAATDGHSYLTRPLLLSGCANLLAIPEEVIENQLIDMQLQKDIWLEESAGELRVFLPYYYYAENYAAKKLAELSLSSVEKPKNIEKEISAYEQSAGITLAQKQKEALAESMSSGVLIITGGPGTGKTTTVRAVITLLRQEGLDIELAAPTGRAAKRMSEATGMEAKTIHRLLGIKFMSEESNRQTFDKDEDSPLEADVIIIDEASMIDILLLSSLLKAVALGTRLIFLGDIDQLPSVGAGNVLRDLISSNCITTVRLTEIFRQAQQSAIVTNAHLINEGKYPVLKNNKDFFFMKRTVLPEVTSTLIDLLTKRLPEYLNCNMLRDIQVLTPMRKSSLGCIELNRILQQALNPPSPHKKEKEFRQTIFREGDKVMQIKNNYNITWREYKNGRAISGEGTGVFNGDDGIISGISEEAGSLTVLFDDCREVTYDYSQLEELELSYAVTIHKSQGCEYKAVVLPLHSGPPMLMSRNLLYTAVTRAKELAVLVGTEDTIARMVDNNREVLRFTALNDRLIKMTHFLSSQA